jgi:hypothetical protein
MSQFSKIIGDYVKSQSPVYIWGIGAEFFITATFTNLLQCNIVKLVDINIKKQQLRYQDKDIFSPETLKNSGENDTIFIFSVFGKEKMREYLNNIASKSKVIIFDKNILIED